ncbi:hypothetical protein DQ04_20671000 [Trypanosoma grayi]|uniref:hypothetical protein n=1 Tax=Trypanosoma grayi TaxID=71804 RepID=UPI0004F4920A|nr:hypothetical protein DQ04_20671000 [Trypanosoma grayi]KEG05543.1 hypothetical protein DQ04_20671000 [Trypanosoma grayi]
MALSASALALRRVLVLSPFCHQPIALPAVTPVQRVLHDVLPHGAGSRREEEVTALLERLPAHCNKAKQAMLHARRASTYYRSRYGRGLEAQRKQLQQVQHMSDDEVRRWARSKCLPVRDPLVLS